MLQNTTKAMFSYDNCKYLSAQKGRTFFGTEAKGASLDGLDLRIAKYPVSLYKQVECLVLPVLWF